MIFRAGLKNGIGLSGRRLRAIGKMAVIQVAVWTFFALVFVPQTYFDNSYNSHHKITVWRAFFANEIDFLPWIFISPFVLYLCNRYPFTRQRWLHNGAVLLAISIPVTVFEVVLVRGLYEWTGLAKEHKLAPFFLTLSFAGCFDLLLYWGVVAAGQGMRYYRDAEERALLLTEAHLKMLRGQLHPHFLFNTLNAATELLYDRPESADRVLTNLSDLLRASLRQELTTIRLQDDLLFAKKYIEIQQELLGSRLRVYFMVAPEAFDAAVPAMFLQPLLENAIKHGLSERAEGGTIRLNAAIDDRWLQVSIIDDGKGTTRQALSTSTGTGISNLRARLEQLYRDQHTLRISTSPGRGFSVSIVIPFQECKE